VRRVATETPRELVQALPWPNVRGKRCLVVGSIEPADLVAAAHERGAASVDVTPAPEVRYDVVVAWRHLHGAPDPVAAARSLGAAVRGVVVSCEPLDLWLSVAARGRPLFTLDAGDGVPLGFNGAGHRRLLESAGFAIERTARPFVVPEPGAAEPTGPQRVVTRLLTGGSAPPGQLHRAVLARPEPDRAGG
jgi:hypothetical protein